MKHLTACVVFLGILCLQLPAQAGFWGFERKFVSRKNAAYTEIVQYIYNSLDNSGRSPKEEIPIEFKEVFKAVLEPTAVKIPFRTVKVKGSGRKTEESGVIYFAKGQIVVKHDTVSPKADTSDFVTIGDKLYAWKPGEKKGQILRRFTGDTIELVDYLIDPAMIMRYTYFDYKRSPQSFTASNDQNSTTILGKNSPYSFLGIRFSSAPLWLGTNIIGSLNCKTIVCQPIAADAERTHFEIDRPIPISKIPDELLQLPKNIKFTKSEGTVDQYLSYL